MADDLSNSVPAIPEDGKLDPSLRAAAGAFQTPEGQGFAQDVLGDVQQHVNMLRVANANQDAGDHLVQSFNTVKQNMLGMVNDDPTSTPIATQLIPKLLAPLFGHMEGDSGTEAHNDAATALQREVTHAGVMRMADFHADLAHGLMDQLSEHVGSDEDRSSLGQYINTLQIARNADDAVSSQQAASQQLRASGIAAYHYGSGLLDPSTEQVQFPRTYLADLVKNPDILPGDKAALFQGHANLSQLGDVPQSDPFLVGNIVNRMARGDDISHGELMSHVGSRLTYADALMMQGLNATRTTEFDGHLNDLASVLNDARSKLSNGTRTGDAAYGRFVDWLLPSYRRTGTDGFNAASPSYLFNNTSLDNFRPRYYDIDTGPRPERRSLSDIFGQGNEVNVEGSLGKGEEPEKRVTVRHNVQF